MDQKIQNLMTLKLKDTNFINVFQISIYKRYSDKTKYMHFMIKDEKKIDKYMTFWEKVSNIIKKNL